MNALRRVLEFVLDLPRAYTVYTYWQYEQTEFAKWQRKQRETDFHPTVE